MLDSAVDKHYRFLPLAVHLNIAAADFRHKVLGIRVIVPPRREKNDVSEYYESEHIHCKAIVAQDYSWDHSHWQADRSLADWLKEEKIPGIYGVDTRALTKHLREHGSMLGKILVDGASDVPYYDPNAENLVAKVSCRGGTP